MVKKPLGDSLSLFTENKFSVILFSILIILTFFMMGIDARHQILSKARQIIAIPGSPVTQLINLPQVIFTEISDLSETKTSLKKSNIALKKQLHTLTIENQKHNFIQSENEMLRKKLRLQTLNQNQNQIAEIILPSIKMNQNIITINKGKNDNVQAGALIVNELGLVGQIQAVFQDTSEAFSLTSKRFAVAAILEGNQGNVILHGNGETLNIPYIPIQEKIDIGDIYVTSGLAQLYPKGIKIGSVTNILPTSDTQFNQIIITPFTRPLTFSQIMIFNPQHDN